MKLFQSVCLFFFRLAYFERTNILVTQSQLLADAQDHYISQAVKQAYVFVLGLDVLGNPYGLFRDVKEGISDFFYEPYLVNFSLLVMMFVFKMLYSFIGSTYWPVVMFDVLKSCMVVWQWFCYATFSIQNKLV